MGLACTTAGNTRIVRGLRYAGGTVRMMSGEQGNGIFTIWASDDDEHNACVVCLCGELDVSTVPLFLSEIHPIVGSRRHIIMDVRLLEYADSTAVAAILSTAKLVRQTGRRFCLTGSHGVVAKIMDTIHVASQMDRFDDVDAALESVSSA